MPSNAPAVNASPDAQQHRRRVSRPLGLAGVFFSGARRGGVSEATEAIIATSEGRLESASDGLERAWKTLRSDLALSLRTRSLDEARLNADAANIQTALQQLQGEQLAAFRALHDALTREQRQAIAERIRTASMANPASTGQAAADGSKPSGSSGAPTGMLKYLEADLGLDPNQQRQLAPNLARLDRASTPATKLARAEAGQRQISKLLDNFEADQFGALLADLRPVGVGTDESIEREIALTRYLLPVLRAEQAERFARTLESQ